MKVGERGEKKVEMTAGGSACLLAEVTVAMTASWMDVALVVG